MLVTFNPLDGAALQTDMIIYQGHYYMGSGTLQKTVRKTNINNVWKRQFLYTQAQLRSA